MLKKVIVSMLAVSLLGQNMLFAQGFIQEDLRFVQHRAKIALSEIKVGPGVITAIGTVGVATIGAVMYKRAITRAVKAEELIAGRKAFEEYVGNTQNVMSSFYSFIEEVRGMKNEQQSQVLWIESELDKLAKQVEKNPKALKNIWARWAEQRTTLSGKALFTEDEAWLLEYVSTHNNVLSRNPKDLIPALKDLALNRTPAAKSFARALLKRGGVALGLVFVFAATAQASSDGKMVQRIMNNPKLFMEADEAGLQEIAQNPDADTFVRAYTKGLETLAALPQAEREAILNESAKAEQEARRQVSTLRPVKAR